MSVLNFPFLLLTASLCIGIISGTYFGVSLSTSFFILSIVLTVFVVVWFLAKRMYSSIRCFTIITVLFFCVFGNVLVQFHNPKSKKIHYSHLLNNRSSATEKEIVFEIRERLKPTQFYDKYVVCFRKVGDRSVEGKVLLRVAKIDSMQKLSMGGVFASYTTVDAIPKVYNPDQFDYRLYLSRKGIFHQVTLQPKEIVNTGYSENSIYKTAANIRERLIEKLQMQGFTKEQFSIIQALLLGQRQDIDPEILKDYQNAGAVHILAISGLHIGILMLLLQWLLAPLDFWYLKGAIIKTILIILTLWSFTWISGLSPSVLRATTMFSFLAIGNHLQTQNSSYNALAVSAFLLLCFDPLLLFAVGFQLSYVAVIAIVWIHPKIHLMYQPKFWLDQKLWDTLTVTLAAQIGVLPLSLYYFHQFPALFFVSNLLIIPVLGGFLGLGVLVLILSQLSLLPKFLAQVFGYCIDWMNGVVRWVAHQENFVITHIYFSDVMLISSYGLIICVVICFTKVSNVRIYAIAFCVFVLLGCMIFRQNQNPSNLIIYHTTGKTVIGELHNRKLSFYSNDSISEKQRDFLITNYLTKKQSHFDITLPLENAYIYKSNQLIVIDSTTIFEVTTFQKPIVLLSHSPNVNLEYVIDRLQPTVIVADGSNYKTDIIRWQKSCEQYQIPFYSTITNGAFVLE